MNFITANASVIISRKTSKRLHLPPPRHFSNPRSSSSSGIKPAVLRKKSQNHPHPSSKNCQPFLEKTHNTPTATAVHLPRPPSVSHTLSNPYPNIARLKDVLTPSKVSDKQRYPPRHV